MFTLQFYRLQQLEKMIRFESEGRSHLPGILLQDRYFFPNKDPAQD